MSTEKIHEVNRTIHEEIEYPSHEQRKESSEFTHNKTILIKQLDLPCWICGSRDSREVHHIHEWSLWNALDHKKVLETLHVFDPYGYTQKMGMTIPIETPDDIRNLLVLCGEHSLNGNIVKGGHHRGVDLGVHELTMPIWIALRSLLPNIEITKAIQHSKEEDKKEKEKLNKKSS